MRKKVFPTHSSDLGDRGCSRLKSAYRRCFLKVASRRNIIAQEERSPARGVGRPAATIFADDRPDVKRKSSHPL